MNCPTCHSPNEPDARFCKNCGGTLAAGDTLAIPATGHSARLPFFIGGAVLLIALIIGAFLLLPRPTNDTVALDPASGGGTIDLGDGASLTLLPENLAEPIRLKATTISLDDASNETVAQSGIDLTMLPLPAPLSLAGDIYTFDIDDDSPPSATLVLSPADFDNHYRTTDLYGWIDHTWQRLPVQVDMDNHTLEAKLNPLPKAVALMQIEPNESIITADMTAGDQLPNSDQSITELLLTGFTVQTDGRITSPDDLPDASQSSILVPSVRNWREDGTPTAAIADILSDPGQRQRHIEAIVGLTLSGGYPAVQLNYRQLDAAQRQTYSQFITDLAAALHAQNRALFVQVATPSRKSTSEWETGAYDWAALGQMADRVQVPLPISPPTLASGETEALLAWAVSQIDRSKVQPIISLYPIEAAGGHVTTLTLSDVLAQLGPLTAVDADDDIHPGDDITVNLTELAADQIELDPTTKMLHFSGTLNKELHQYYFPTSAALGYFLEQVARYNVAGVVVENLFDEAIDDQKWVLLQGYRELSVPAVKSKMTWLWTVTGEGQIVGESFETALAEPFLDWTAPDRPGEYQINLELSLGGDPNLVLPVSDAPFEVAAKPVATRTPTPKKKTPSSTPKASPSPTATASSAAPPPPPPPPPSRTHQLAYSKWDGQFHNLYVADTNGNNERLLFTRAAGPAWSPDMKRLFFAGEQGVGQQMRDNRLACEFGTISDGIVAIDLSNPLQDICQVQSDSWFCERKSVDLQQAPSDVCTANGVSVYQNLDWKVGSARWASTAPDGDAVAFDAKPGGAYSIYFRAMLGTSQQFHFELVGEQGSWSPDGQRMVYRSGRDNKSGLWISNRDDSGHTLVTNDGTDSFPTWSADGQKIAFARNVNGNLDIYVMNVDGSNVQRLTDAPGHDTLPVFTPDGDLIFRSDRSGSWGIWRMRGDGSDQIQIIPNAGVGPDWAYSKMDVK